MVLTTVFNTPLNTKSFDSYPPLNERAPVLNISKVFGKVWYEHLPILLFYMVEGNLLKPIINYFYSKLQQIVIKRSNIFLKRYRSRCSRRFCFYTFDIPHRYKDLYYGIQSTFKIFTNDTFLFLS